RAARRRERRGVQAVVVEWGRVADEGLASARRLKSLARSAERVPPGLAFQVQAVKPRVRHARLLGGGPTGTVQVPFLSVAFVRDRVPSTSPRRKTEAVVNICTACA